MAESRAVSVDSLPAQHPNASNRALDQHSELNVSANESTNTPARSQPADISEMTVLWLTAGLGCDGDTIAMTAATQPSIEDLVRGGLSMDSQSQFS